MRLAVVLLLMGCRTIITAEVVDLSGVSDLSGSDLLSAVDSTSSADLQLSHVACTCNGGCPANEDCLESQGGGLGPDGVVCGPKTGIPECRPIGVNGCPSERPTRIIVTLSAGCCSDAFGRVVICCANADATDNTDCL